MAFEGMRFGISDGRSPLADPILRVASRGQELSIPALRALSPLSDKAQVMVDKAVVDVGVERLQFVKDLIAAGLEYNGFDPFSMSQLEWDQESKAGAAIRAMSPSARHENIMTDRKHKRLPIYFTLDGFSLDIRTLKTSERVGQPLDVSIVKQATRRDLESIEDAFINGPTTGDGQPFVDSGYPVYGLLNEPNANSGNTSVDWTDSAGVIGTQGPGMVTDILKGISVLQQDFKYGPYNVYLGTLAGNVINNDFKVNTLDTIRTRLEQIDAGGTKLTFKVADRMPAGNVSGQAQFVIVQMTDDVVQVVNGSAPTVIPWTSLDGMVLHWLVLAAMVPRVRSDYDGNSGIYIGLKP
jgi:hypothetical protein